MLVFCYRDYTHHEFLGVDFDASVQEVENAYVSMCQKIDEYYGSYGRRELTDAARAAHAVLSYAPSRDEYEFWLKTNPQFLSQHGVDPLTRPRRFNLRPLRALPALSPGADPHSGVDPALLPPQLADGQLAQERLISPVPRRSIFSRYGSIAVLPLLAVLAVLAGITGQGLAVAYTVILAISFARCAWGYRSGIGLSFWSVLGLLGCFFVGLDSLSHDKTFHPWLGFSVILAIAVVSSLLPAAISVKAARAKFAEVADIPFLTRKAGAVRVWGVPGGGLESAVDKFGQDNVDKGRVGEEATALGLEHLLAIPGVRIFHGLRYPLGYGDADVDHAVVCGNKVAFIDSKLWTSAYYSLYGDVVYADRGYPERDVSAFVHAVQAMADQIPGVEMLGWVNIHSSDPAHPVVGIDVNTTPGMVRLGTPQSTIEQIADWFLRDHNGRVNLALLYELHHRLQNPVAHVKP